MTESTASVLVRRSTCGDKAAIERLAKANGQTARGSSFLLAEIRGTLVAAAPLDVRGEIVGASTPTTSDVRELLRRIAKGIRSRRANAKEPAARAA